MHLGIDGEMASERHQAHPREAAQLVGVVVIHTGGSQMLGCDGSVRWLQDDLALRTARDRDDHAVPVASGKVLGEVGRGHDDSQGTRVRT